MEYPHQDTTPLSQVGCKPGAAGRWIASFSTGENAEKLDKISLMRTTEFLAKSEETLLRNVDEAIGRSTLGLSRLHKPDQEAKKRILAADGLAEA